MLTVLCLLALLRISCSLHLVGGWLKSPMGRQKFRFCGTAHEVRALECPQVNMRNRMGYFFRHTIRNFTEKFVCTRLWKFMEDLTAFMQNFRSHHRHLFFKSIHIFPAFIHFSTLLAEDFFSLQFLYYNSVCFFFKCVRLQCSHRRCREELINVRKHVSPSSRLPFHSRLLADMKAFKWRIWPVACEMPRDFTKACAETNSQNSGQSVGEADRESVITFSQCGPNAQVAT